MRYLIDTNVFVRYATDRSLLSQDVMAILRDYDNIICLSVESMRELVVSFNNKGLVSKYWKTAKDMLQDITNKYYIEILPICQEYMMTYADLCLNRAQNHKDPSDHVIISQAITMKLPLITSDRKFKFYESQGLNLIFNER